MTTISNWCKCLFTRTPRRNMLLSLWLNGYACTLSSPFIFITCMLVQEILQNYTAYIPSRALQIMCLIPPPTHTHTSLIQHLTITVWKSHLISAHCICPGVPSIRVQEETLWSKPPMEIFHFGRWAALEVQSNGNLSSNFNSIVAKHYQDFF